MYEVIVRHPDHERLEKLRKGVSSRAATAHAAIHIARR